MPPKKPNLPGKKVEQKQKDKVIEDKTFGLKNKKGGKQQKFIKMVQHQVRNPNQSVSKLESQKFDDKKKRDNDELNELNKLLKPVTAMPKIDKQVDPKSILCVFYKQGTCGKGDKCKFSHDLDIERKSEKRNIYVDKRDDDEDNFENWDEDKLADVVNKKHGEKDQNKPRTEIICKYFLQALEESKYGWFWECPNGDSCIYRHALPSGFVLKKDKVKLEQVNKEDEITLEDLIEKERAALGSNLTKITFESFCSWKKRKLHERQRERAKEEKRKRTELKAGKDVGLSGRELFTYNPDLVTQDDDEADDTKYLVAVDEEQDENEAKAQDVDESMFLNGYDLPGASTSLGIDEDLFNDDIDDLPDDDDDENGDEDEEEDENDQNGRGSDEDIQHDDDDDPETIRDNVNRLNVNSSNVN